MPASRSISRSSSTNGTRSSAASAPPSVVLPAPRRPISATRLRRDAASSPKSRIRRKTTSSSRCAGSRSRKRRISRCSTELSRGIEQFGQRHTEGARDAAQQQHRRIALAGFQLREIALGDAGTLGNRLACQAAPLPRLADVPPHRGQELGIVRVGGGACRRSGGAVGQRGGHRRILRTRKGAMQRNILHVIDAGQALWIVSMAMTTWFRVTGLGFVSSRPLCHVEAVSHAVLCLTIWKS